MPAKPKPVHVMSATPGPAHITLAKPEPAHLMSTTPTPAYRMSATPKTLLELRPGLKGLIASVMDPMVMCCPFYLPREFTSPQLFTFHLKQTEMCLVSA